MKVTTTHEIKPHQHNPKHGALIVHVFLNGEEVGTTQPLSGPLTDIKQFVAGEIDMVEVRRRWGFKG